MSELIKIASADGPADANVVFVHGLGAHPYWTWGNESAAKTDMGSYWPLWAADEYSNIDVWILSYATPKTNWFGSALELEDRVRTVMARLRTTEDMLDKPTVFVCHSLGGLLVKSLLRKAAQNQSGEAGYQKLLANTKGVSFVATPHLGASLAKWADRMRFICWPSLATIGLTKNSSYLRELNAWFENWNDRPKVLIFYGTEDKVVEVSSANPGLPHVEPVPLEGSHSSVCIPRSKNSLLPQTVFDFLEAVLPVSKAPQGNISGKPTSLPKIDRRKMPVLPFVLRGAFLAGLIGLAAWLALAMISPAPADPSEGTPKIPVDKPTGETPPLEGPTGTPSSLPPQTGPTESPSEPPAAGQRVCGHINLPPVKGNRAKIDQQIRLKRKHAYITNGTFGDTNYIVNTDRSNRELYTYTVRILVYDGMDQASALCERLKGDGQSCIAVRGRC